MTARIARCAGEAWTNLGAFVHDYQTLIAGVIAILAAFITARPVWRQLRSMSIQTSTVYREFLAERVRSLMARRKWLADKLDPFVMEVGRRIYEMRELEGRLNIHWIFERDQIAWSLINELEADRAERRDPATIAVTLDDVMLRLRELQDTLSDIHWPEHNDQTGEDYAFSDEEWAAILQKSRDADARLDTVISDFEIAKKKLDEAVEAELRGLRDRLKEIDDRLLEAAD